MRPTWKPSSNTFYLDGKAHRREKPQLSIGAFPFFLTSTEGGDTICDCPRRSGEAAGLPENPMPLSFAADILPLFRDEPDIMAMKRYGLDLSSHEEVKEKAKEIYETLEDGSMPCDNPWPKDHVAPFKRWMDEGMAA